MIVKLLGVSNFNLTPQKAGMPRDLTTMMKNWDDIFQSRPARCEESRNQGRDGRSMGERISISPR